MNTSTRDKQLKEVEPLLTALGIFTVSWSGLQATMEMTVWALLNIGHVRGRIVTSQLQTSALIEMLQTILSSETADKEGIETTKTAFNQFIEELKTLNSKRNEIMHSHWQMDIDRDEIKSLKASRHLAKGKLRTHEREWSKEDLEKLCIEVIQANNRLNSVAHLAIKANKENKANTPIPPIE